MQLNDLNFTDDLALLPHTQQQMQETTSVAAASATVGFNTACTNPITLDVEDLEDVKTFKYLGNIIDEHSGSDAHVNERISKTRAAYSQLKNIWNCRPTPRSEFSIQMSRQFYYMGRKPGELQKPSSRRYRCLLTVVYAKYLVYILARHYKQQNTVGENKPDPSGRRNQEEALEVDRAHIEESTQLRYKAIPRVESSGSKEERKTTGHITSGNGDRHEKNEQQLDGTRKEGPGQSGLGNTGRRPTLHWV
ncbi:unnamed protein product [Schistosoma mattheei]|uniref:Uncharacterized protein n=1 Tax=Schistosoma mattheei TaxID=31246 RepID=A0A183PFR5_9TREM|nr:unnamed protein product [Schistosoma mattheei]